MTRYTNENNAWIETVAKLAEAHATEMGADKRKARHYASDIVFALENLLPDVFDTGRGCEDPEPTMVPPSLMTFSQWDTWCERAVLERVVDEARCDMEEAGKAVDEAGKQSPCDMEALKSALKVYANKVFKFGDLAKRLDTMTGCSTPVNTPTS